MNKNKEHKIFAFDYSILIYTKYDVDFSIKIEAMDRIYIPLDNKQQKLILDRCRVVRKTLSKTTWKHTQKMMVQ